VRHGHIMLNERKTDIPSALVKEDDTISWKESSSNTEYYKQLVPSIESKIIPGWLSLDMEKLIGRVASLPTPDDIEVKVEWQSIIEYYSR